MAAAKRTRMIITRAEGQSFQVGEALITIVRGFRNRNVCRIEIKAPPEYRILRDEFFPGGRKGPAPAPSEHGGNYIDPRGDSEAA